MIVVEVRGIHTVSHDQKSDGTTPLFRREQNEGTYSTRFLDKKDMNIQYGHSEASTRTSYASSYSSALRSLFVSVPGHNGYGASDGYHVVRVRSAAADMLNFRYERSRLPPGNVHLLVRSL